MKEKIRIASGQGFWGDWLEAPKHQVRNGPIDYLVMDYLAEVTMSIMMKQKLKDPDKGYATDFVVLMDELLPEIKSKNIKVIANAGGVNPRACAHHIKEAAKKKGLTGVNIAIVYGDDILDELPSLIDRGVSLENMDTGESIETVLSKLYSANAYFGARPVVEALKLGADIVITGRVTDTGITLAPMIYEFGWSFSDYDKLASGTVAGHILECGAQASGGNFSYHWQDVPDLANVGFPIAEVYPDSSFIVTKHPNSGGMVSVRTVTEQLVYELGDPKDYITPDCIADFTSIRLEEKGDDRVLVNGVKGKEPTPFYKVSCSYSWGYKAIGSMVYSWPDAYGKAKRAYEILESRLNALSLKFDKIHHEFIGVNACHGDVAPKVPIQDIPEVMLHVGVRAKEREPVERFTREIAPLILTGPPTATGFGAGRPKVQEIVAYWPALIPKDRVTPKVEIIN